MAASQISRILVAVDGSSNSIEAAEFAFAIAKGFDSQILLISVIPSLSHYSLPPHVSEGFESHVRANFRELLKRLEGEAATRGLKASAHVLEGYPPEAICLEVNSQKPDLVVLGSRGLRGSEMPLLGSVSQTVAHRSTRPVLIVRRPTDFSCVLVPTDGSQSAQRALEFSALLAGKFASRLVALHVSESGTPDSQEVLKQASELLKERGVKGETRNAVGSVANEIVKAAEDERASILIMGTMGKSSLPFFTMGGVADRVTSYAPCPVLLVR